jgi:DNA polymerase (family 10)
MSGTPEGAVENLEIAAVLAELADLLEIQGANPFRIRAYRQAVQTISGFGRPLSDMVAEGEDLTEIPTIGKDIAAAIEELVETRRLRRLVELGEEIPRSLAELIRIEGLGPRKVRRIWDELGVTTVEGLEEAVKDGRLAELEGFGVRSADKLLRAIQEHRKRKGRILLSEADVLVLPLVRHMQKAPGVKRVDVAGSYRRRQETIGDIDLLVLCDGEREPVMSHFLDYEGVGNVEMAGDTRGSVVLDSGLSVDLRILGSRSYGAALHYFTGSKEHNVAIRTLGVKRGLRISEYGVFRVPEDADPEQAGVEDGERVGGRTEEEVFAAVGLPWIPPVLRANRGEIEAARDGELPDLVELDHICGDLHVHSTWTDGRATIEEMARACKARGYEYMAITDHTQALAMSDGLTPERARAQWKEVDEVNGRLRGFRILKGLEVDILRDGTLDMPDDVLEELDLVVVAVHSLMDMSRKAMTERVVKALHNRHVDIFAHPTGRKLNRREPYDVDLEMVLRAARELDVAVELNASPRRLDLNDVNARRARDLGVTLSINTDAHVPEHLDSMRYGVDQARRGWLEPGDVLNTRPLSELLVWLDRRAA